MTHNLELTSGEFDLLKNIYAGAAEDLHDDPSGVVDSAQGMRDLVGAYESLGEKFGCDFWMLGSPFEVRRLRECMTDEFWKGRKA